MSLRTRLIEAGSRVLDDLDEYMPMTDWSQDAEAVLDAFLAVLSESADEWAEEKANRYMTTAAWGAATDEEATIQNLLAVLQGEPDE
jgi:hypothetical protein